MRVPLPRQRRRGQARPTSPSRTGRSRPIERYMAVRSARSLGSVRWVHPVAVRPAVPCAAGASTAEVGPPQHRGRDRQAERLRRLFALPLGFRLCADLEVGEGGAAVFRTSRTTSCHQCSAGALSSPSSRWRVSANVGSWCHPSQSARVLHVPTITRLSSWSAGRRSCPPTQPGRSLAADRRLRMTASQSRPAPGFRYTWVTIVFIAKPPGLLVGHCQSN